MVTGFDDAEDEGVGVWHGLTVDFGAAPFQGQLFRHALEGELGQGPGQLTLEGVDPGPYLAECHFSCS